MRAPDGAGTIAGRIRLRSHQTACFALVAFGFLVAMVGTTLPTPLYALLAERYAFGAFTVNVIIAIYAFAVIAGLLVFGNLSDEIGRKPVLVLGLVLSGLSALIFLVADSVGAICAARVLSGLSAGVFAGTATAMLVDLAPGGNARLASVVAVIANLGGLGLGGLLAGVLAENFDAPLRLPFIVDLGLLVPATIGLLLAPETVEPWPVSSQNAEPERPGGGPRCLHRRSCRRVAGFAVMGRLRIGDAGDSWSAARAHKPCACRVSRIRPHHGRGCRPALRTPRFRSARARIGLRPFARRRRTACPCLGSRVPGDLDRVGRRGRAGSGLGARRRARGHQPARAGTPARRDGIEFLRRDVRRAVTA